LREVLCAELLDKRVSVVEEEGSVSVFGEVRGEGDGYEGVVATEKKV
jgi:hypothetical protein